MSDPVYKAAFQVGDAIVVMPEKMDDDWEQDWFVEWLRLIADVVEKRFARSRAQRELDYQI